jgi:methylthioribose-1-phosphate isomerase
MNRPIRWIAPWTLEVLDQTRLPFAVEWVWLRSAAACRHAIVTMQVRGAPLIGAVGAFGLAYALRESTDASGVHASGVKASDAPPRLSGAVGRVPADLDAMVAWLASARPTAVNLAWAVTRVAEVVRPVPASQRADVAWAEAVRIAEEDAAGNAAIGAHGAELLRPLVTPRRPVQLLTHCNAGWLATAGHGTALAPIYALHDAGVPVHVWVDETRPRNQGAALTAWELAAAGVPHTVIADNAGGLLLMRGEVDAVIVGADRVAANGDVANKVGTYLKALAAQAHGVPCYVACPVSTIDPATPSGDAIEIEERDAAEVAYVTGADDDGAVRRVRVVTSGTATANPAFDLTPAALVTALITERGVVPATADGIRALTVGAAR